MGVRHRKKEILTILARPDLDGILRLLDAMPAKEVVNALFSAICLADERVRWHGVSAMGRTMARLADQEMEEARIMMRRFLWSLNDESGGIGWGAPESMAESMHHHDRLAEEYIHMLISYARPDGPELEQDGNFLEHELLQRGLLWGYIRLCERRREMLLERGLAADIPPYLQARDHVVRGLAARLCGLLHVPDVEQRLAGLRQEQELVRIYDNGEFHEYTVGDLARQALQELQK